MIHPFISIIILLGFGKACRKTIQFFYFPANTLFIVGIIHIANSMVLPWTVNDFPNIPQTFNLD